MNLAHQIYDFVDKNICNLDRELKSFDVELQRERARLGLPVSCCLSSLVKIQVPCGQSG